MRVDAVSLAAGVVVAALGGLVLLDSSGVEVSIGWIAVALTGGIGAILLVSGLAGGDSERRR